MPSYKSDDQVSLVDQIKTLPAKRKYLLTSIGLTVGLGICVAIIVVVVAFASEGSGGIEPPIIDPVKLTDRIDCLPWLKNKSAHLIEKECESHSYCVFNPSEVEPEAPLCFYNMSQIKLKLVSNKETELGMDLMINGTLLKNPLMIRIEFYDNYGLRMKVGR